MSRSSAVVLFFTMGFEQGGAKRKKTVRWTVQTVEKHAEACFFMTESKGFFGDYRRLHVATSF